uniref:putative reverse transcriptase/maturase n=1 Tax=Chroodactylon ornatum TaxID=139907 RepID=UPI001FCDFEB2|nr:putative reverse transcriptase/maturase [Chroodactylon ornatum]UNJ14588.1 putative reverse transcriptase/maturase [Chroodactylon ornatum]
MSNSVHLLQQLQKNAYNYPNQTYSNIFLFFLQKDLYYFAYKQVKVNLRLTGYKFSRTVYLNDHLINSVISQLQNNSYSFEQYDLNIRDKKLPISQHRMIDYVLQEMIYLILKSIFSSKIKANTNIYWPEDNPHLAFQYIEHQFKQGQWIIKGSLNKIFQQEDYVNLLEYLATTITDQKFLNLVRVVLRQNFLNIKAPCHPITEVILIPGTRLLYILLDLYYANLDNLIHGIAQTIILGNSIRNSLQDTHTYQIIQRGKSTSSTSRIGNNQNLIVSYIRYGNVFICFLHYKATYDHILWVKNQVELYLTKSIRLPYKDFSLKMINSATQKLNFLGYQMTFINNTVVFNLSTSDIIQILFRYRFLRYTSKGKIRPTSQNKLLANSDSTIMHAYKYLWDYFTQYYSGIRKMKRLYYVRYYLVYSCAMTLAHKHRSTVKKMLVRYKEEFKLHFNLNPSQAFVLNNRQTWHCSVHFSNPFMKY